MDANQLKAILLEKDKEIASLKSQLAAQAPNATEKPARQTLDVPQPSPAVPAPNANEKLAAETLQVPKSLPAAQAAETTEEELQPLQQDLPPRNPGEQSSAWFEERDAICKMEEKIRAGERIMSDMRDSVKKALEVGSYRLVPIPTNQGLPNVVCEECHTICEQGCKKELMIGTGKDIEQAILEQQQPGAAAAAEPGAAAALQAALQRHQKTFGDCACIKNGGWGFYYDDNEIDPETGGPKKVRSFCGHSSSSHSHMRGYEWHRQKTEQIVIDKCAKILAKVARGEEKLAEDCRVLAERKQRLAEMTYPEAAK